MKGPGRLTRINHLPITASCTDILLGHQIRFAVYLLLVLGFAALRHSTLSYDILSGPLISLCNSITHRKISLGVCIKALVEDSVKICTNKTCSMLARGCGVQEDQLGRLHGSWRANRQQLIAAKATRCVILRYRTIDEPLGDLSIVQVTFP